MPYMIELLKEEDIDLLISAGILSKSWVAEFRKTVVNNPRNAQHLFQTP